MLNTNLNRILALLVGTILIVSACKKDPPKPTPKPDPKPDVEDTTATKIDKKNVKDHAKWHYFSFETGKFVGEGNADPAEADDAAWKERTDWDIAFHRNNVKTNSGLSGNGQGGVLKLDTEDFDSVKEVPADGNFLTDVEYAEFLITPAMPPSYVTSTVNPVLNNWVVFDHQTTSWIVERKDVFIVKSANGKYAKLQFVNFLNESDQSGFITLKYVYLKDGGTTF